MSEDEPLDAVETLNRRRVTAWRAVADAEALAGRWTRAELARRVADEIERSGMASDQSIEEFERDLEGDE